MPALSSSDLEDLGRAGGASVSQLSRLSRCRELGRSWALALLAAGRSKKEGTSLARFERRRGRRTCLRRGSEPLRPPRGLQRTPALGCRSWLQKSSQLSALPLFLSLSRALALSTGIIASAWKLPNTEASEELSLLGAQATKSQGWNLPFCQHIRTLPTLPSFPPSLRS